MASDKLTLSFERVNDYFTNTFKALLPQLTK